MAKIPTKKPSEQFESMQQIRDRILTVGLSGCAGSAVGIQDISEKIFAERFDVRMSENQPKTARGQKGLDVTVGMVRRPLVEPPEEAHAPDTREGVR